MGGIWPILVIWESDESAEEVAYPYLEASMMKLALLC